MSDRVRCAAVVFVGAFGLYLWTLAPTVTLVDSGELIVAARTLGVAHPPGFPLYVLLAHLVTLLPVGSIAVRVNVASALFAACASAFVALATLEAMTADRAAAPPAPSKLTPKERRARAKAAPEAPAAPEPQAIAFALLAGLLFACSRTLWAYATMAEVYALNSLLIAVIVWLLLRWRRTRNDRSINAAALVFGLALGVHHVTVGLLLPAFATLVLLTEGGSFLFSRRLLMAGAWAVAGLVVYAYLPIAASRSPLLNWGDPRTLDRFLAHVTGFQYRVFFATRPEDIGHQLAEFLRLAGREFGPVRLPLALALAYVGLGAMAKRSPALAWFVAVAIVVNLAYNANYEIAEDKDAYYLPVFLVLTIAAAFGARAVVARVARSPRVAVLSAATLATLVPVVALAGNYPRDNRRHFFIARDYVENVLASVADGGMLLTLDWEVYSPAFYLREIEQYRRDVVMIDLNQLRRSWYFDYLRRAYPDTMRGVQREANAFLDDLRQWERDADLYRRDVALNQRISSRFEDLILALVNKHATSGPVYVTRDVTSYREGGSFDWAAKLAASYQFAPDGLVFQLYADRVVHELASPSLNLRGLADHSLRLDPEDVANTKVRPAYVAMFYNRGRYLAKAGHRDEAIEAFRQALSIDPQSAPVQRALAEIQSR